MSLSIINYIFSKKHYFKQTQVYKKQTLANSKSWQSQGSQYYKTTIPLLEDHFLRVTDKSLSGLLRGKGEEQLGLCHCSGNIEETSLKHSFLKSQKPWWHVKWFLMVGRKKNLQQLPAEATQKRDAALPPEMSAAACREAAATPQYQWRCAPCHSTGTSRAATHKAAHSLVPCQEMPGLICGTTRFTSRKGPLRKRNYFNFIKFLMLPLSEVKVRINVSLEGKGIVIQLFFIHSPLFKISRNLY